MRQNTLVDGVDEQAQRNGKAGGRRYPHHSQKQQPAVVLLQTGECQPIGPQNGGLVESDGGKGERGCCPNGGAGREQNGGSVMDRQVNWMGKEGGTKEGKSFSDLIF